jgi:AhpD family alkylhydroperoxidase
MQRLNYATASPEALPKLQAVSAFVHHAGIDPKLLELIFLRASQINGCAWCLEFHSRRALHAGETQQRLNLLAAWRDAPVYSPKERAALEWTEAVTQIAGRQVPDEIYQRARQEFNDTDLTNLTIAVGMINLWNRLNVAFQTDLSSVPQPA